MRSGVVSGASSGARRAASGMAIKPATIRITAPTTIAASVGSILRRAGVARSSCGVFDILYSWVAFWDVLGVGYWGLGVRHCEAQYLIPKTAPRHLARSVY